MLETVSEINPRSRVCDFFGLSESELGARGSLATAKEIVQQPEIWRATERLVESRRTEIDQWLHPKLAIPGIQVFFCGAGTSAFIGDSIASWLRAESFSTNFVRYESVSTTDLVADPKQFLSSDLPTIVVSFARSGDSPESVACVEQATANLSRCYHLILTCNSEGQLAKYAEDRKDVLCLLMPEGTNDRGFAMTSSYSSMLVACAMIFGPNHESLKKVTQCAEGILSSKVKSIRAEAQKPYERLVILGAGPLNGTAKEAALKSLELAAGNVLTMSDSPLGFRHGPKIMVNAATTVIVMRSMDSQTSKYDLDLIDELRADGKAGNIVELHPSVLFQNDADFLPTSDIQDIWLSLVYIVYCQILAFWKSFDLGIAVDSPCPGGEVNRVVQGVSIYPFRIQKH